MPLDNLYLLKVTSLSNDISAFGAFRSISSDVMIMLLDLSA